MNESDISQHRSAQLAVLIPITLEISLRVLPCPLLADWDRREDGAHEFLLQVEKARHGTNKALLV